MTRPAMTEHIAYSAESAERIVQAIEEMLYGNRLYRGADSVHPPYDLKSGTEKPVAAYKRLFRDVSGEIQQRTGKIVRKDAVVLSVWSFSCPEEMPGGKNKDELMNCVYRWFSDMFGEKYLVTAAVDTSTYTMRFAYLPVVLRNGERHLSAKETDTPKTIRATSKWLSEHIYQNLGYRLNIVNKNNVDAGEWVYPEQGKPYCSVCGYEILPHQNTPHCPFCGTRMEE